MSACGILGALLGTLFAGAVSPNLLRKFFGAMLTTAGIIGIFKK
jgi:uncharacterized membrane protein YfcA